MWRLFWAFTFLYCVSSSGIKELSHQPNILNESNILMQPKVFTEREQPNAPDPTSKPQLLSFKAVDVNTYNVIDPMVDYDPNNIVCQHYGAYFLPHPTDCSSYYVCAFGHMLHHECGRGTGWNYKRQLCEMRPIAECYAGSIIEAEAEEDAEAPVDSQSSDTPSNHGEFTVCYILTDGIAGPLTWVSQTTESEQFQHTPATIDAISSTGRVNASTEMPTCPKSDEAYLPHSTDCTKYYICIIGMPVLTSCPKGLYWNQRTEFCDWPANVECQQNKS